MTAAVVDGAEAGLRAAIAADLRTLALLHDREPSAELLAELGAMPSAQWLAATPEGRTALGGMRLIEESLARLGETPGAAALDALAVDYADIYLRFALRVAPSESAWLDDEGLERQAAMFAVRALYRRHGVAAADWRKRPDDHLVTELEFLARLVEDGDASGWRAAAAKFLEQHVLRWVPEFAARVADRCATRYFAGVALLTSGYLEELGALLGCRADAIAPLERARAPAETGCQGC